MKEIAGSAELGFGAGQSTMDLYVTLTDLSQPEKPLYTVGKHDDSGKRVGAVVTMNPYAAVAKFGEVFEGIRDAGHSGISQNERSSLGASWVFSIHARVRMEERRQRRLG